MSEQRFDLDERSHTSGPEVHTGAEAYGSYAAYQGPSVTASEVPDTGVASVRLMDDKAPVILLFGPPSSGKSMTLVRLARYLKGRGYEVKPDTNFMCGDAYMARCSQFNRDINTEVALAPTSLDEFLMVLVYDHGRLVCQILEAPGEHYFDSNSAGHTGANDFPAYMSRIISGRNRKVWAFIAEAGWNVPHPVKDAYVTRIRNCKNQLVQSRDEVIMIFNKIDRLGHLFVKGRIMASQAEKEMDSEYRGLSKVFANDNPITSLWRKSDYRFVPFSTGSYTVQAGYTQYTESRDIFPQTLWETMLKCIKG